MINLEKTNLRAMKRDEILNITRQELEEYKQVRVSNTNSCEKLVRQKNLQTLERRLQPFGMGDSEVLEVRIEINGLLDEDVYRKTTPKERVLNEYELNRKQYSDYLTACKNLYRK